MFVVVVVVDTEAPVVTEVFVEVVVVDGECGSPEQEIVGSLSLIENLNLF